MRKWGMATKFGIPQLIFVPHWLPHFLHVRSLNRYQFSINIQLSSGIGKWLKLVGISTSLGVHYPYVTKRCSWTTNKQIQATHKLVLLWSWRWVSASFKAVYSTRHNHLQRWRYNAAMAHYIVKRHPIYQQLTCLFCFSVLKKGTLGCSIQSQTL